MRFETFHSWAAKHLAGQVVLDVPNSSPTTGHRMTEIHSLVTRHYNASSREPDLMCSPELLLGVGEYASLLLEHSRYLRAESAIKDQRFLVAESTLKTVMMEIRYFGMWTRRRYRFRTTQMVEDAILETDTAFLLGGDTREQRRMNYRDFKPRTRHPKYGELTETLIETPKLIPRVCLFTLLLYTSGMDKMEELRF